MAGHEPMANTRRIVLSGAYRRNSRVISFSSPCPRQSRHPKVAFHSKSRPCSPWRRFAGDKDHPDFRKSCRRNWLVQSPPAIDEQEHLYVQFVLQQQTGTGPEPVENHEYKLSMITTPG